MQLAKDYLILNRLQDDIHNMLLILKTREESEFDFDDWIKEYLKRERKSY